MEEVEDGEGWDALPDEQLTGNMSISCMMRMSKVDWKACVQKRLDLMRESVRRESDLAAQFLSGKSH